MASRVCRTHLHTAQMRHAFLCLAIQGTSPCPTCHLRHVAVGVPFSMACFATQWHEPANNIHCRHGWYSCLRRQRPPSTPGYASCRSAPPWPLVNRWTPRGYNRPSWASSRCSKSNVDPTTSIFTPGRSCFLATVYMSIALQGYVMDLAWFGWLVVAIQRVPHVRCGPYDAHLSTSPFHFTPSNHGHGAKVWHLPHNDLPWGSKAGHAIEIQAGSHNGDPKPDHTMENGDPQLVHTMEIQSWFTQWGSTVGSHNGDPKLFHTMEIQSWFTKCRSEPVYTMAIQSRFTQWRSKAGSYNGNPKQGHTMEIQPGSHNGDPKPVHKMEIQS